MRAVVVLPTYNEVDNIDAVLAGLARIDDAARSERLEKAGTDRLDGTGPSPIDGVRRGEVGDAGPGALESCVDVVVVDDSSPDGTAERVKELGASYRPGMVHLLVRPRPEGLAPAYRAGFAWALEHHYDAVVQMDADGSHPTAVVASLLTALRSGADLALGARYIPGGSTDSNWAWHRKALSSAGNTYARLVLGLPYRDLTGGFKAWRSNLLAAISPVGGNLYGYAFQIHTTYAAHRHGARIVEVPFRFKERVHGTSKMHGRIVSEGLSAVVTMRLHPPAAGGRPSGPG